MTHSNIFALDTETFYASDYSVADMGAWHYVRDERFDCYMLSVAGSNGLRWTGHPRDFDWSLINGPDSVFLSHNVGFDNVVLERLVELGNIPPLQYAEWHDTADLAAYLGAPRNLAGASALLLNKEMSKEMRGHMSGRRFEDLPEEKKQAMIDYAQKDADNCLELWLKHGSKWPEHERRLSRWTRNIPARGVPVDMERVNAGVESLRQQRDEALGQIPWVANGKAPLSRPELDAYCLSLGIEVPKSLAKDSEEAAEWEEKYAADHPFVDAVRTFRRVNTLCQKLETVQRKSVGSLFRAEMLYFGATTTGRWSGAGGFNIQNLPRDEMFGVNLRKCFEAPAGFSFVVFDLAQIEPRCLAVLAGNHKLLSAISQGFGIYEAYARANLKWGGGPLKKEDPQLYRLAKAACVSGDTLVLTDSGYKPISTISLVDMVWDGYNWVSHEGAVITKYGKPTCTIGGDQFTDDHQLFISDTKTLRAGKVPEGGYAAKLERNSHQLGGWKENRALAFAIIRVCKECWEETIHISKVLMRTLWNRALGKRKQSIQRDN